MKTETLKKLNSDLFITLYRDKWVLCHPKYGYLGLKSNNAIYAPDGGIVVLQLILETGFENYDDKFFYDPSKQVRYTFK